MSYAATGSQEGSGHGGARALDRLLHLSSLDDKWTVEYIWLGGNDGDLRGKTRTLEGPIRAVSDIPTWNYDGSSTNQAPGIDSEVTLVPRKVYRDPFRAFSPSATTIPGGSTRLQRSMAIRPGAPGARGPAEIALAAAAAAGSAGGGASPSAPPTPAAAASVASASQPSATDRDDESTRRVTGFSEDEYEYVGELGRFPFPSNASKDLVKGETVFGDCRELLVLCDCYEPATRAPLKTNARARAARIFGHPDVACEEPWFGIEQEYTLLDSTTGWPIGWPVGGFPAPQGPYYCGVGKMYGREIAEAHFRACHYAGLDVGGLNAEVMPSQWEFQVGPCVGIDAGDQLWVARYILQRVCELRGDVVVTLDPKPVAGDWNGAGAHANYSTRSMRTPALGGIKMMERAIARLRERHAEHIAAYGSGNERRLTGKHETAAMDEFSYGVADRGASIRIGNESYLARAGYMEDRRPAANMDPYVVTAMLAETTLFQPEDASEVAAALDLPVESTSKPPAPRGSLSSAFAGISMGMGGGGKGASEDVSDDADSSASESARARQPIA